MQQAQYQPIIQQPYLPATFKDRGVAVPFTTPVLGGTRIRAAARFRIELVVRNMGDGRGVYVTPWTDGAALWRPTLHDRVLISRIAMLESISPTSVLGAARATAAEGLAGEAAMTAARITTENDLALRDITSRRLLMAMVRQVNVTSDQATNDLAALARIASDWLAIKLNKPIAWLAAALEAVAALLAGIGEQGRVPRLIGGLRELRDDIAEWSRVQWRGDRSSCAYTIYAAAELTLSLAETALSEARGAAVDVIGLLRAWSIDQAPLIRLVTRPEWLLDGWELIRLVWNNARDDAARRAALVEMADYVPAMPKEASDCNDDTSDLIARRPRSSDADWRNGASLADLIARNERFRALAL